MRGRWTFGLFLVLALTWSTPRESAAATKWLVKDKSVHDTRPTRVDVEATVGFIGYFGGGVGGWFVLPIVPDGFIPALNDSFSLEMGVTFEYHRWAGSYSYVRIVPLGGVRWDFHLTKDWTVFAKAKFGWELGMAESGWSETNRVGGPAADFGLGAYYHFTKGVALRLDLGNFGASAGLSFEI